jgi:hypothetical protein
MTARFVRQNPDSRVSNLVSLCDPRHSLAREKCDLDVTSLFANGELAR